MAAEDWLYETGEALLAPAVAAVDVDSLASWVTMGQPVAEFYDGIWAWLQDIGPDRQSIRNEQRVSGCGGGFRPYLTARWEIQLWLECWPTATTDSDRIVVPTPAQLQAASETLHRHGAAMHEALLVAVCQGFIGMPDRVEKVTLGAMAPLGPQGGTSGWRIPIEVAAR